MKARALKRTRTWRRVMDAHSACERARREQEARQAAEARARAENPPPNPPIRQ